MKKSDTAQSPKNTGSVMYSSQSEKGGAVGISPALALSSLLDRQEF